MSQAGGSVTKWIQLLKEGDEAAALPIWQRYFEGLVRLARAELRGAPSAAADEEDVAISAFHSLCAGAARGNFPHLENRDDLWRLLVTITLRKAFDQVQRQRRQKRGGQHKSPDRARSGVASESDPLAQLTAPEPTPEIAAMLAEQYRIMFERLRDDSLRRVAHLRLEGYTGEEIADRLGCTRRTVTRKLDVIRKVWQEEPSA
jgi:RNA polymerase sigma factor (sigma-70 family)